MLIGKGRKKNLRLGARNFKGTFFLKLKGYFLKAKKGTSLFIPKSWGGTYPQCPQFLQLCHMIMRTLCILFFPTIASGFRIPRSKRDGSFTSDLSTYEWDHVTVLKKIDQGSYGSTLRALAADRCKEASCCRQETVRVLDLIQVFLSFKLSSRSFWGNLDFKTQ